MLQEKNKELADLGDTVDRIIEADNSNDHTTNSNTSWLWAKSQIKALEGKVSKLEQTNEKLEQDVLKYKTQAQRTLPTGASPRNSQRKTSDNTEELQAKLKSKDETISHLMDQLKKLKLGSLDSPGSHHQRSVSPGRLAGLWGNRLHN